MSARKTKLRPWQFSLRSLLLLTTLIAALLGWRLREVDRQRRAVAAIQELGGEIEIEPRGLTWLHRLGCGELCREVVAVDLPGTRAAEAALLLANLPSLGVDVESYAGAGPSGCNRPLSTAPVG